MGMMMRPRASESDYLSPREIATLGRGTSAGSAVLGKPHYSRSYTLDTGSIGQVSLLFDANYYIIAIIINHAIIANTFLDASTHLYKRLRPSVRRSVGP